MAIDQVPALTDPVNLVDPQKKRFYPLQIPLVHDQLRHFISVSDDDIIWYASANKIFKIKNECRQLVTWVDFQIHCLAAAHGWICVGGTGKGRFAFRTQDLHSATRETSASAVDEQLPLGLRSSAARSESPDGLRYLPHARGSQQRASTSGGPRPINYRNIGSDLVNAITIQKIVPTKPGATAEVVALLANNDRTVTIFSLDQMRVLKVLHFDTLMNHASLSADGRLFIACGDTNKAYFYAGQELERDNVTGRVEFDWKFVASPAVSCFPLVDNCFSTAFSPDGKHCSIASQTGVMALIDVEKVNEDMSGDEIVWRSFATTRTGMHLSEAQQLTWGGGVGCVAFSPRSQRLLAFAERSGRVLVVDLDFPRRPPQIIELTRDDPESVPVELSNPMSADDNDIDESSFSYDLQRLGIQNRLEAYRREAERWDNERRDVETRLAANLVEDAAHQRRLQELLRTLRREHSPPLEGQTRLLDLIRSELRNGRRSSIDNTGAVSTSDRDLPPPPRRRSSIVLGTATNAATTSSSHPSSLAPPPILATTSTMSTSPSRYLPSDMRSSPSSSRSRNTSAVTPGDSQEAWNTISSAIASATHDSRRATLEQNLRNLRETHDTLQRASQLYRTREEATRTSSGSREWTGNSSVQALPRPSQSTTELASVDISSRNRRSASVSRARQYLSETGRRSTLEESINVSQARLRMLENDLDQIDREHATFTARASRLWQESGGSGSNSNNTQSSNIGSANAAASTDVPLFPSAMQELLEASRRAVSPERPRRERDSATEWPDLVGRGDPSRFLYMPLTGDYAWPHLNRRAETGSRSAGGRGSSSGGGGGVELLIMGMAWNSTGSILHVATQDGIYNLKATQAFHRTFAAPSVPL